MWQGLSCFFWRGMFISCKLGKWCIVPKNDILWVLLLGMEHLNLWVRTGTKDLKRSQEYPRSFGQRVAECHLKYMSSASWLAKRKLNNWHSPGQRSWSICSLRKWLPVGIAGFVANLHRFPCPFGLCTLSRFEADRMAILGGAVVRSYKYKPCSWGKQDPLK